jgi:DNA-binding MarR family transcriptional regulator
MESPQPFDDLIVTIFRLNGRLIEAGNRLVEDIGLTSAWWQVLGALALSPVSLPVAHIARNMGLARQSVQRVVDLLAERGFVGLEANPHHARAKLVTLTPTGQRAYEEAVNRQRPWAERVRQGLSDDQIAAAVELLRKLDRQIAESDTTSNEGKPT